MPAVDDSVRVLNQYKQHLGHACSAKQQLKRLVQQHKTCLLQLQTQQLRLRKARAAAEDAINGHAAALLQQLRERWADALRGVAQDYELKLLPLDGHITQLERSVRHLESLAQGLYCSPTMTAADSVNHISELTGRLYNAMQQGEAVVAQCGPSLTRPEGWQTAESFCGLCVRSKQQRRSKQLLLQPDGSDDDALLLGQSRAGGKRKPPADQQLGEHGSGRGVAITTFAAADVDLTDTRVSGGGLRSSRQHKQQLQQQAVQLSPRQWNCQRRAKLKYQQQCEQQQQQQQQQQPRQQQDAQLQEQRQDWCADGFGLAQYDCAAGSDILTGSLRAGGSRGSAAATTAEGVRSTLRYSSSGRPTSGRQVGHQTIQHSDVDWLDELSFSTQAATAAAGGAEGTATYGTAGPSLSAGGAAAQPSNSSGSTPYSLAGEATLGDAWLQTQPVLQQHDSNVMNEAAAAAAAAGLSSYSGSTAGAEPHATMSAAISRSSRATSRAVSFAADRTVGSDVSTAEQQQLRGSGGGASAAPAASVPQAEVGQLQQQLQDRSEVVQAAWEEVHRLAGQLSNHVLADPAAAAAVQLSDSLRASRAAALQTAHAQAVVPAATA